MQEPLWALTPLALVLLGGGVAVAAPNFETEIRPLLEKKCVVCHGPEKKKNGFRLDTREFLLAGGEGGVAVVPGKSEQSLIYKYATRQVADMEMPPDDDQALTKGELTLLAAWIDGGASFPAKTALRVPGSTKPVQDARDHWAWKPPVRPAVPPAAPADRAWIRNPIDAFVLARLRKEGLSPRPEADPLTLLRRLHLDLTGLLPTIAELDAFVADRKPGALDRVTDNLLASPHYGERWGRHWLDAAHYADTDGFEKDKMRTVWSYRDWVIRAFNRDLPYDQFVIEQMAGDLLRNPTQDQLIATGFLRNSLLNEEGGVDPEQFRMEAMFDRMDVLGKAVLGVGTGCAQCHTHKFDPILHEDYYRLMAFLNNDHEPNIAVYTAAEQMKRAEIFRSARDIEEGLRHTNPDWEARMNRWEAAVTTAPTKWTTLQAPFIDDSTGGQKYMMQKDGAYMAQGYAPTKHGARVVLKADLPQISALQLEVLTDPNLPLGGPGRSFKGTFALTDIEIEAASLDAPLKKTAVKVAKATADYEQGVAPLEENFTDKTDVKRVVGGVAMAIDGKNETAWGIDAGPGRRNRDRKAVFTFAEPVHFPGGAMLTVTLKQNHGGWNSDDNMTNNLGRFRLSVTGTRDVVADPVPRPVREILGIPRPRRSPAQVAAVFSYFRTTQPGWKRENEQIESAWRAYPEGTPTLVLAMRDSLRTTHLLKRGDFLKPGKSVQAGVPAFLNPLPKGAPANRLTLGRWLVDRGAPTTARVLVNRIWQAYFGTGIVLNSEDFGMQGERPTHPELLDWLAVEFMDRGWRLKDMHRLITRSAAYRQSSHVTPELVAKDPANRLMSRGPRFRVEGEIIRDIQLAASGLLNLKMGGRAVMPPQPAFLSATPVSYGPFPWVEDTGPDRYRRGVYVFRRRSVPYPTLQTFDTPPGDTACVRRLRSNTPLQALVTLNETTALEAAQALGRQMLQGAGTDDARLVQGFRRVLSRVPDDVEVTELKTLLARQKQRIAEGWVNPWLVAGADGGRPKSLPTGATPADLAAYTLVARAILNLDEAVTKE